MKSDSFGSIAVVARSLVLLLLTAQLSGCAWLTGLNPFGGDDEEDVGPAPLVDFEPEGRLREVWDAGIGSGLGDRYTRLVPAIVGDRVYAADAFGVVEALSVATGERIWQARVGSPAGGLLGSFVFWSRDNDGGSFVTGGIHADAERVFLGTKDGEFIALRAEDGVELWRTQMSSEVLAPSATDAERVFVMTLDGRLTALSASDGSRVWSYDTQVPVLTLRGTGAPVYSEPLVFAGFANGRLTALRSDDGEAIWEHVVTLPSGRSELERIADLDAAPLITPVGAFIASYQGALKSLRLIDGAVQWEQPLSSFSGLAEGYGEVFSTDADGIIRAMDQNSGAVVWEQDSLLRRKVTGPAVFGPYLAVGDFEGYIHVFAQSDGRPVARLRVDRDGVRNEPLGVGDRLMVQGNGGRVAVYSFERSD